MIKKQKKTSSKSSTKASTKTRGKSQPTQKEKKPTVKKEEKPKRTRTVKPKIKSEISLNEDIAVKGCSTLKKGIEKNDFSDWEIIGELHWHSIKGLMHGNNISVSMREEGRKKKYTLYLLSVQGTEITTEFDAFSYKHTDNKINMAFYLGDKVQVTHTVKYGE